MDIFGRRKTKTTQSSNKKSYYSLNDLVDVKESLEGKEDSLYGFKYFNHSYMIEEIFFPETIDGVPENVPLNIKRVGNKLIYVEEDSGEDTILNGLEENKKYEITKRLDVIVLVEKVENDFNHNMKDNFVYKLNETIYLVFIETDQIYFYHKDPTFPIYQLNLEDQISFTNRSSKEERKFTMSSTGDKKYLKIGGNPVSDSSDLCLWIAANNNLLYYLPEGIKLFIIGEVINPHSNKLTFIFDKNKAIHKSFIGNNFEYSSGELFLYEIEREGSEKLIVFEKTRTSRLEIKTIKEYIDKIYISPDIMISEIYIKLK